MRGLNNKKSGAELRRILFKQKLNLVCIQETKMEMGDIKVLREIDHELSLTGVFSSSRGQ